MSAWGNLEDKNANLPKGAVPAKFCEYVVNGEVCGRKGTRLHIYRYRVDDPITLCGEHFWELITGLSVEVVGINGGRLNYDRQR